MTQHSSSISLAGKKILIAGGTTGIGRSLAAMVVAEGADVFLFGRDQKTLDAALVQIGGQEGRAGGTTADVSRPDEVARAFALGEKEMGGVDIVICGAAIGWSLTVDSRDEDWQYVIQTNLCGTIACAREAAARMKKKREGHILLIGSLSAEVQEPNGSMYVASKGGIRALAGSMRKELNPHGISVSLLEPGCTATDLHGEDAAIMDKKVQEFIMLRPEDVAATILFIITRRIGCEITSLHVRPRMELI